MANRYRRWLVQRRSWLILPEQALAPRTTPAFGSKAVVRCRCVFGLVITHQVLETVWRLAGLATRLLIPMAIWHSLRICPGALLTERTTIVCGPRLPAL